MTDSEEKVELQYIVWQYLQKESPSIAAKFKKQKKIKPREEAEVSLFNLYDMYKRNKSDAVKRESESEIEESPVNKKARLCQEENTVEDGLVKVSEKDVNIEQRSEENDSLNQEDKSNEKSQDDKSDVKTQDDKLDEKNQEGDKADEKSQEDDKSEENLSLNEIGLHANSDKVTEQDDNSKPIVSESNVPSEDSSERKPAAESESSNEKKKALLPKPERKKTLLSTPFSSIHKNDPNFYKKDDRRKTLLPEPSAPVPAVGPSGRKTLLAEPAYNSGRKPLLPEPLPLLPQYKRATMPLLMESLPPRQSILQEKKSRIDRMDLLAESPPLDPLYSGIERAALLNRPLEPDQSDHMYKSKRRSLLGGPPEHYHASQERKAGLLKEIPSLLNLDDVSGKRRAFLPNQPPLLCQRECMQRSADHTELSDYQLYCKGEAGSSSKPSECEYDDSSHLYFRRARTKEAASENPLWEDEEAVLVAKLKDYLKRLSRCSKKFSAITERFGLEDKPANPQNFEVHKLPRIAHPSFSNPDSYACYMQEKNVSMRRRDQILPERSGLTEKLMGDKLGAELIKKKAVNHNEARIRKYEEELKSIGINMTSEMNNAFRRATENEFASPDQEMQQRLYERYDQKMGFL